MEAASAVQTAGRPADVAAEPPAAVAAMTPTTMAAGPTPATAAVAAGAAAAGQSYVAATAAAVRAAAPTTEWIFPAARMGRTGGDVMVRGDKNKGK